MSPSEITRFLATAAHAAPSADNSQPLDFSWDGQQFAIAYSRARGAGKLFAARSHATLLTAGASIENVAMALSALGLDGVWKVYAAQAPERPYAELTLAGRCDLDRLPMDIPLFKRRTNRFPYTSAPLPAETLAAISQMTQGTARATVLSSQNPNKKKIASYARVAAEARFCTRELHEWLASSLRFTRAEIDSGEGLDVHTLHLPPGGLSFMRFIASWPRMAMLNQFGLFKAMAYVETQLLNAAPALVCIVGDRGPNDVVAAGGLMADIWGELNVQGIAVHPYYVITDQLQRLQDDAVPAGMVARVRRIQEGLQPLLGLRPDETLHMVLRIGRPSVDPPGARRLPLSAVYADLSEE